MQSVITEASTDPKGSSGGRIALQITFFESKEAGLTALYRNNCGLPPWVRQLSWAGAIPGEGLN